MFRKLVKSGDIEIDGQRYPLHYFVQSTSRGGNRFSCEILLGPTDQIIIDGDSMTGLESRVARLAPAMMYSRLLAAGGRPVAA